MRRGRSFILCSRTKYCTPDADNIIKRRCGDKNANLIRKERIKENSEAIYFPIFEEEMETLYGFNENRKIGWEQIGTS